MSKKRFIWQRRLSAGLSVLLCLSMLSVAALAATVILGDRSVKRELKRRFHV